MEPCNPAPPLPFEDRQHSPSFWNRTGQTLRLGFTDPLAFYDRIPHSDSLTAPWRFQLLLSIPLYFFILLYAAIFAMAGAAASLTANRGEAIPFAIATGCSFLALLAIPLFQGAAMVILGTIVHGFLWLWRGTGAGVPLRQTIRATGYTQAFLNLLCLFPPVAFFALLAAPILLGIGLARIHRTQTWRGICAMVTKVILAGGLALVLIMGFIVWAIRTEEKSRHIQPAPTLELEPSPNQPEDEGPEV